MVGMVFALVSVTVNRFDLLPDFVGYGLIAFAAHNLAQYAGRFGIVRNLALPLLLLSLSIYFLSAGVVGGVLLAETVLMVVLVCFLLGAVIQFVTDRGRPDLVDHAILYRRIFVGVGIAAFFVQWISLVRPEEATGLVSIISLATIIILAFILRLLYVVRHDLATDVPAAV